MAKKGVGIFALMYSFCKLKRYITAFPLVYRGLGLSLSGLPVFLGVSENGGKNKN